MTTMKKKSTTKPIKCPAASARRRAPLRLTRILVTTDFSEESKTALPYAAALANLLGSEVVLLNVLEPPPRFAGLKSVALLQSGDAPMGRLYAGLDALDGQAFGNKTRVATHVRTGSVAERVVRHAHCPVLVVRELKR
jgi:nucleotide-binding universal stress UspA family protein